MATASSRATYEVWTTSRARRAGFVTLPARMQEVQTETRFGVPFTSARTRWMFGFQRRFVRRCECDTRIPNPGDLPQISQTAATKNTPALHDAQAMQPGSGGRTARWILKVTIAFRRDRTKSPP
jgi:hypothetical protein